jgi:uncharacterized protein (AIM24 family)
VAITYALEEFVAGLHERDADDGGFALESPRVLRIDVDGGVWLKPGAAIAYRGDVSFERRPTLEAASLADLAMREIAPIVRATGRGRLYCGHHGWHIRIVRLAGESLVVSAEELLAFEESLTFETRLVEHGLGLAAGGLLAVGLSGHGALAIGMHGSALVLPVTPEAPVRTDPQATIAWSGTLSPRLQTDLSWRSVIGHGGHEPVQMHFEGTGHVVVQPYEDPRRVSFNLHLVERLRAVFGAP